MINQSKINQRIKHRLVALTVVLFVFAFSAYAQTINISGTVSDENGPLPGVSVVVKGTTKGAATDFDGKYSLNDVPSNATLVVTYLGYKSQELAVNGRTAINVTLSEDLSQLEEVVVVGYGTMERANVTGAISTVDMQQVEKVPLPNVVEALRGQVSGLRVSRGNGQPGSGVNFTIRGYNSIGEGADNVADANQPIIVVDGVPLPGGNLNEINPDDIESINIIKDAGAGAIYGSSAANGVVLITTKSGKSGKPTITVNAYTGINQVVQTVDIMNGDQYVKYLFDAGEGTTLSQVLHANELENYIAGRSVDWQDELLRQGFVSNVNVSITGGTETLSLYMNGDMYREQGIVTDSDYNRYSFRLNGEFKPSDRFKIGARVQLTKSDADETSNAIEDFPNDNGGFAPFIPIFNNTPLGDLYADDGTYAKFVTDDQFQINPFHRYAESIQDRFINRTYVNPYVEVGICSGLTYTLNTFVESRNQFFGRFYSSDYVDGDPNEAQIQKQSSVNYLVDNIFHYKKDFGKHGIDATVVVGFQKDEWEQLNAYADNLATDLLGYNAIDDSATDNQVINWDTDESGRYYYVGRLSYNYDGRYILTGTVRRDGSSKFTGDNKWGTFPSISLAWNANNESFWNQDGFLNNLKLRLSYGVLGNDRIGTYRYLANSRTVSSVIFVDSDNDPTTEPDQVTVVGYAKDTPPNPDLKWETSKQFNVGVDFGMLNNRISGSVDYYNTRTTDLLLPEILPITSGYSEIINNVGETKNWGIDVSLKGNVVQAGDFNWDMTINWAKDKNEIVKLNRSSVDSEGNPVDDIANGWFIGQDINEIFNYKFIGVWQSDEVDEAAVYGAQPGDAKFLDVNGDGAITPGEDKVFLGNPTPDWYGGITNTFSYKGFELTILIEAVQGITAVNSFIGSYTGRNNQVAIDYWTPDNPSNEYPRVGPYDNYTGDRGDAVKTKDASFVSLRNISLTYNLSPKALENTFLKAVSLYVRGNNLKYWTDFDNAYSPETGIGTYPITKTWTFGTSITF